MKLLALHGYSLNGKVMRHLCRPLGLDLVCPDGPMPANPETVRRVAEAMGLPPGPEPHLSWWDASDDGQTYRGFDETKALLARLLAQHAPAGILGFSQGAILGGLACALSVAGELPPIACAVLIAGRLPRAASLLAHFARPIAIPSLHLVGARDVLTPTAMSEELAAKFVDAEVHRWNGPHVIPTRGPAMEAIQEFVRAQDGRASG